MVILNVGEKRDERRIKVFEVQEKNHGISPRRLIHDNRRKAHTEDEKLNAIPNNPGNEISEAAEEREEKRSI